MKGELYMRNKSFIKILFLKSLSFRQLQDLWKFLFFSTQNGFKNDLIFPDQQWNLASQF